MADRWGGRATAALLLLLLGSVRGPAPQAAPAVPGPIRVVLDGAELRLDVPPVQVGSRVLVPVRGLFERLGARVEFDSGAQVVVATRGSTSVLLRLGSREAQINDRSVTLDVPALVIQGRTMVPLRFLSEALGARVDWEEASRTVRIFTTPPSPPQPSPGSVVIEGVVVRLEAAAGRLQVLQGSAQQTVTVSVTGDTVILRNEVATGAGGSANIRELRPGDQVTIQANGRLEATAIRATYRLVRGIVTEIRARTIVLQDRPPLSLHPDVTISGRASTREEIRFGMTVLLRLNPVTNIVWEITVE